MKILVTVISLLVIGQAHASLFLSNTTLPTELQQLIVNTIKKEVPCVALYSLKETETLVREERIDQGVVDYFFTTKITGQYYFDSYHPAAMDVVIETAEYDISNPAFQKYEVLSSNLSDFVCDFPY